MGPFIGRFLAGYIASGSILIGKAGGPAGIFAAIVVCIADFAGLLSHPLAGYVPAVGTGSSWLLLLALSVPPIAFLAVLLQVSSGNTFFTFFPVRKYYYLKSSFFPHGTE
jgi:hypothetical protein